MKPYVIVILREGESLSQEQDEVLWARFKDYHETIVVHEPSDGWSPAELKDFVNCFRWPTIVVVEGASRMLTVRELAEAVGAHDFAELEGMDPPEWGAKVSLLLVMHKAQCGRWTLS